MSDFHNLSVVCLAPPKDVPSNVIALLDIHCNVLGLASTGNLLTDPLTDEERNDLRWYLEEYWQWPYEQFLERAKLVEALLPSLGQRLYHALFRSPEALSIAQKWRDEPEKVHQISILSEIPQALSLPWELLHDGQDFLALRPSFPVSTIRRLPLPHKISHSVSSQLPLRILVITSRPKGLFVDPRSIARKIVNELQEQVEIGTIEVDFLRPPTLEALQARLSQSERPVHILHFDGHGIFNSGIASGGMLAFENNNGWLDAVKPTTLAHLLQSNSISLVVLTACQSAVSTDDNVFSSIAAQLIGSGVNAVIAMSASILVESASRYTEAFYRALAANLSVPLAQEKARQSLYDNPHRHLHQRSRDEEGELVKLQDWWLPHFYQQQPMTFHFTPSPHQVVARRKLSVRRLSENMPAPPRYGFSGRAQELFDIERWLRQGKMAIIHGLSGIGKSALAREVADWLTQMGMYDGACFVSFKSGGDTSTLLKSLGNYLGVHDEHLKLDNKSAALTQLHSLVEQQHTLVIIDDLETILPGGEGPLEGELLAQLWEVLYDLLQLNVGILLICQGTTESLTCGTEVKHLLLRGLQPDDAYAFARQILQDDVKRSPYHELYHLLAQLDYHPQAIQLVLPHLREQPLSRIAADFTKLLHIFIDTSEPKRNGSLLVSLKQSLKHLTREQRALVSRFVLFEGGANEDDILRITKIPQAEWTILRSQMERCGLLIVEQIHQKINVPFIHFHPILLPFLRRRSPAANGRLRNRFMSDYLELVRYLHMNSFDSSYTISIRSLFQRELPNLRRALELLIQANKLEDATSMALCLDHFLTSQEMTPELHEVQSLLAKRLVTTNGNPGKRLTFNEYLYESQLGDEELERGDSRASFARFSALLTRIEVLPEQGPYILGYKSYPHCLILIRLARCLEYEGTFAATEELLREAITLTNTLLQKHHYRHYYTLNAKDIAQGKLGDVLQKQGKYSQARDVYEEVLRESRKKRNLQGQLTAHYGLGTLAVRQSNYSEAQVCLKEALDIAISLGETKKQENIWLSMGSVAKKQKQWSLSEMYYRKSLSLLDHLRDMTGIVHTSNELGIIAEANKRFLEAEGRYKKALEVAEQIDSESSLIAMCCNNLALLLVKEVQKGHATLPSLSQAKSYAQRALVINEKRDPEPGGGIWNPLAILAIIAEMEGEEEVSKAYRIREYEAFVAFVGNRDGYLRILGEFIQTVMHAAGGDENEQTEVERTLPMLERNGLHVTEVIHRILSGERNWYTLIEDMRSRAPALLVKLILESLAKNAKSRPLE